MLKERLTNIVFVLIFKEKRKACYYEAKCLYSLPVHVQ